MGSCEIKMCQNPVGAGTIAKSCASVATLASSIIGGAAFPHQHQALFKEGPSYLVINVAQTNDRDTKYNDCGEPDSPCTF